MKDKRYLLEVTASCTIEEISLEAPDMPILSLLLQFLLSESQCSGGKAMSFTLLFRPQVHKIVLIKISQLSSAKGSYSGMCRIGRGDKVFFYFFSLDPEAASPLSFRDTKDKISQPFQDIKLLVSFQPMHMFIHSNLIKLSSITPLEMLSVSCCEDDWYKALFLGFSN